MDETRYDHLETYCGMLGHLVRFSYCRKPGSSTPCSRLTGCWRGAFPVDDFLASLPAAEMSKPGKGRVDVILQAVELAKSR